tara:strand:+ start:684 stop:1427 length:744 start_codon:yes stop_codon:yes gene_type:complete
MKTISRDIIPEGFRYVTNIYNKQHGCEGEADGGKRSLIVRIDHAKYKFYKIYKLNNQTPLCINLSNVGLDYIGLIFGACELGIPLTKDYNNCELHIHNNLKYKKVPNSIYHSEFTKLPIKNQHLYKNLQERRGRPDSVIYDNITHEIAIKEIKQYAKQFNGKIMHIGYKDHLDVLTKFFFPSLASANVSIHTGIGYENFEEAKKRITYVFDSQIIDRTHCTPDTVGSFNKQLQANGYPERKYYIDVF